MKKILSFLFTIIFILSAFSQSKDYIDSGFSANFPKSLTIEKKVLNTSLGEVNLTLYLAKGEDFMIMFSENKYDIELLKSFDSERVKKMLSGAKNGAMNNLAKQLESNFIETSGEYFLYDNKYSGNKYEGTIGEYKIEGKTFLKNNQMYQILVIGNTKSKEVITFINSFKLI